MGIIKIPKLFYLCFCALHKKEGKISHSQTIQFWTYPLEKPPVL